jgi:hypothetical protein
MKPLNQSQSSLFGALPGPDKQAKAKALPKITAPPLPPAAASARDKALASVRSARARARVGDTRVSEDSKCKACGEPLTEQLVAIGKIVMVDGVAQMNEDGSIATEQQELGGQTWMTCRCKKCVG